MVKAPDGRELAVETAGDPRGRPIVLMHGTPGSRVGPLPRATVLYRLGIRLVSFDRPGYGDSTRLPGRRVSAAAADVRTIADELGLDRFAVLGRSGGGPHALA
ncbi:alpha/beta fold hydrolase, partial [Kitasatospora sp. NPDC047058]|uniref:alpha/beta fold hydrolase n=1 Tax=Kitasatospora sp. NPDC047058 TaxID=3155620 RepID=UPI0034050CEF